MACVDTIDREEIDSSEISDEEEPYCYCGMPNNGLMIACDGPRCEYEWWHYDCAGLTEDSIPDNEWICSECIRHKPTSKQRHKPKLKHSGQVPQHAKTKNENRLKSQENEKLLSADDLRSRADGLFAKALRSCLESEVLQVNPILSADVRRLIDGIQAMDMNRLRPFAVDLLEFVDVTIRAGGSKLPSSQGLELILSEFHQLCLSDVFEERVRELVRASAVEITTKTVEFFTQILLDEILTVLMKTTVTVDITNGPTADVERLNASEEQILRYVAGYTPFKLLRHFRRFPNNRLSTKCIAVLESWRVKGGCNERTFLEYTRRWFDEINRGHAFDVNDQVYLFFRHVEQAIRPVLRQDRIGRLVTVHLKKVLLEKIEESVIIHIAWDAITSSMDDVVVADLLKKRLLTCYVKLRCTAFCKVYTMLNKRVNMGSSKCQKSLRKCVDK